MKLLHIFFFIVSPLLSFVSFSQEKFEKEYRINHEAVPNNAKEVIDLFHFDGKIKWYKEIGMNIISYEAKAKKDGKRYSVEFTKEGDFEDVEVKTPFKLLGDQIKKTIEQTLRSQFVSFKIIKTQIQYSGKPEAIQMFLHDKSTSNSIVVKYELVVSGKVENTYSTYEFLFSDTGEFLQKKQIVPRSTDNLEY